MRPVRAPNGSRLPLTPSASFFVNGDNASDPSTKRTDLGTVRLHLRPRRSTSGHVQGRARHRCARRALWRSSDLPQPTTDGSTSIRPSSRTRNSRAISRRSTSRSPRSSASRVRYGGHLTDPGTRAISRSRRASATFVIGALRPLTAQDLVYWSDDSCAHSARAVLKMQGRLGRQVGPVLQPDLRRHR